jgi:hypothetical protein
MGVGWLLIGQKRPFYLGKLKILKLGIHPLWVEGVEDM